MNRWETDDLAHNEPLMAAIGRIALRSAELAEMLDAITWRLDHDAGKRSCEKMLGQKIDIARKAAKSSLSPQPQLKDQFVEFCDHVSSLLRERNSPIHSTFIPNDDEGSFIKWDARSGPEFINLENLNQVASKFEDATARCLQFLLEITDLQQTGIIGGQHDLIC
jgi:hypothetical protein